MSWTHFGTAEEPKAEYENFAGYVNVDTGTGRIRGLTVFGPSEAATVLRKAVEPFSDLGVAGAITSKSRRTGGTDHTSFNAAGLPGIGTQLDPMEYQSHTWHTNLDTYERIVEDDVKAQAVVIAGVVYELAMRDEKLPDSRRKCRRWSRRPRRPRRRLRRPRHRRACHADTVMRS